MKLDNKGRKLLKGESQRPDGRYQYGYIDPNTKERKYVYSWRLKERDPQPFGKKKQLSLREQEAGIEKDLLRGISRSSMTVKELVDLYLEIKDSSLKIRATTKAGHKTVQKIMSKNPFGNKRINEVKQADAEQWLLRLQDEGKGPSSIKQIRGVLRPAFAKAVANEWVIRNPFDFPISDILVSESIRREALTAKQKRIYLEFLKNDNHFSEIYDIVYILLHTGLRISEFCGLTLPDIKFEDGCIVVSKQLRYISDIGMYMEDTTKTKAGMRKVKMSKGVVEAFHRVIENRPPLTIEPTIDGYSGFVFLYKLDRDTRHCNSSFLQSGYKPIVPNQIEKRVQHSVEKYNSIYKEELPEITPHVFRHTYCTELLVNGVGLERVKYLMGHSSIQVTMDIYAHLQYEDIQNNLFSKIDKLDY